MGYRHTVTTAMGPHRSYERSLLDLAERNGFALVHHETETGQLLWEWRRGSEPRPQFVSRRAALHWMEERTGLPHT